MSLVIEPQPVPLTEYSSLFREPLCRRICMNPSFLILASFSNSRTTGSSGLITALRRSN